ncbi:DUF2291 family protein [Aggregatilinea lenta]|uniref:DUF2291 family protein n=1 Tax=Aggregatilinea lenta TaxID=913108 RepID=UPI000E5ABC1E|nr:DUF2291 domain-containing protein [Aggregatilinea lenta]
MVRRLFFRRLSLLVAVGMLASSLSGCVLATVRTINEDEEAKLGFVGADYVDEIWDSQLMPTYNEQAQDLPTLLPLIAQDQGAAIEQFGSRSGTGAYSFMVKGEGKILTFDTSSRAGLAAIDLNPPDGTADVSITIGPLIKISQRAAVRDAVGFIVYNDFSNQEDFAGVANAMGDRILAMLVDKFGAADADSIQDIDPASMEGKTVKFTGAFTLDDPANIIIVPVALEVTD